MSPARPLVCALTYLAGDPLISSFRRVVEMSVEKYTASSLRFASLHLNVCAPILIHSYLFFLTRKSEGHSIVVVVLYARTYNGFETCLEITAVTSEAAGVRHWFQWDHCTDISRSGTWARLG